MLNLPNPRETCISLDIWTALHFQQPLSMNHSNSIGLIDPRERFLETM